MFGKSEFISVYTTFPSEESAAFVASEVIRKKLAACANILPGARSLYWWDGAVQDSREAVMILKTQRRKWRELELEIKTIHPYDVPCIVAVDVAEGHEPYLNWIREQVE